jgi:phosphinothricin acetyltransferase
LHDLTLRPIAEDDIPAIGRIYREAVSTGTASFELEPPDDAEMLRRFQALRASSHPAIVAESGGALLGYAYAGPYRSRPAYRFTVENSVYVDEAARGHGVGRRLLERLIVACTERGFRQMVAIIGDSANAGSVALHRAAGFRLVGTLEAVGWKHGRWLDTVVMQRPLGEGQVTPPAR